MTKTNDLVGALQDRLAKAVAAANLIFKSHAEGADADAGFDAGEFSGPAHDRAQEREIAQLAKESGFTVDEIEAELFRLANLTEFRVIVKVQAANCREAVELAVARLNEGGEPDAVLTSEITFPDPEVEGALVTI